MKQSFYEILGVEKNAPQALIEAAYSIALKQLAEQSAHDSADSANAKVILKAAYDTLSQPEKRAAYNARLENTLPQTTPPASMPIYSNEPSSAETAVQTTLLKRLLLGLLIFGVAYLALGLFNTMMAKRMAEQSMRRILESQQQIQARTERLERDAIAAPLTSPDSAPSSDGASIDFQALNDAAVMEQKRLEKELKAREYELARQQYQHDRESRAEQQAAQHAQYKAQLAQRKAEAELEQQERIAKLRADRENRYYTCLNPAISQYGYDRAQILCARYK